MTHALAAGLHAFNYFMLVYFAVLDVSYALLTVIGWRAVDSYVRRRPLRDYDAVARSPLSIPITILVPAYNEQATIVASVRALLRCHYKQFEVIVINDGSHDRTREVMQEAFDLVPIDRVPRAELKTQPISSISVCPYDHRVVLIDKRNGGKADSLNAGIRYANYPLFCAIDADTLLDPAALSRLAWEFQGSEDTVAVGGIVRVINGSTTHDGIITHIATPRNPIVNLQILEYLRAFLGGRIAWSRLGMLLIISGAFGLFRRDAVVEAGGYDTTTVGEDAELILRLHRTRRDRGKPCRITFFPDPICWTEAPSSLRVLTRQRDRWQRGLIEMLVRHHTMLGRRRYGVIGLCALPYFVLFEALGPPVQLAGYTTFALTLALGLGTPTYLIGFITLTVIFGLIISFVTLLMEERAFQRYPNWRDLAYLIATAVIENFAYRQYLALVCTRAWWRYLRHKSGWGEMTRTGFGNTTPPTQYTEATPRSSPASST